MKYQCRSVAEIIFAYSMADCGMIPDGAPEFKIIVREHKPNRKMIRSLARHGRLCHMFNHIDVKELHVRDMIPAVRNGHITIVDHMINTGFKETMTGHPRRAGEFERCFNMLMIPCVRAKNVNMFVYLMNVFTPTWIYYGSGHYYELVKEMVKYNSMEILKYMTFKVGYSRDISLDYIVIAACNNGYYEIAEQLITYSIRDSDELSQLKSVIPDGHDRIHKLIDAKLKVMRK